ncbi:MAG TPA: hypothetical protein VIM12_06190 [Noviherbaspirillum sp.]|jgi:hypothetical protein|uniref:hypothetical protein n=1 Tax=Noviherbaspirillum sp. TaxID=1926288 RepID=UPI002F93B97B
MSTHAAFLTDEEIFAIAHPLSQPPAIVRWFLKNGFTEIKIRPNGLPLITRVYFDRVTASQAQRAAVGTAPQPDVDAFRRKRGAGKLRVVGAKV